MTQKDKNLLLKDLCARLPYGLKGKVKTTDGNGQEITDDGVINSAFINEYGRAYICIEGIEYELEDVKPYLHPMSSMTEEEKWDFGRIFNSFSYLKLELLENGLSFHEIYDITGMCDITWDELNTAIDWLNAHHFDYRGLIEKGFALKAPKGMYKEEGE